MALTTAWLGAGDVTLAESETDWVNATISAVEQWDLRIQGSYSNAFQASNKDGYGGYVMPSGSYDFSTGGGTHEGQHVFIWMNYLSPFNLEDVATGGGGIYLIVGTDESNYKAFCVADSLTPERYNGGWKLWVVDPSKAATWEVGSPGTLSAATFFGVGVYTNSTFRSDNLFIDAIRVGYGIRAYGSGTSSDSWQDILDDDMGTEANRFGLVQEQDGIIFSYGQIDIGDDVGTTTTTFSDSGKIIQWVNQEYYNSSGVWVPLAAASLSGLNIVDNSTGSTTFTDGVIVGSDQGRAGSTLVGSAVIDTYAKFGTNFVHASSDINLYGTSFNALTGGIQMADYSSFVLYSGVINGCGQFDPVGDPVIRNCIFAQTTDTDAALLWNEDINIQICNFIANTLGAAIEHESAAGTPYSYTRLYFSDNTKDVLNSATALTVNKSGTPASDPSTYEGATVTFAGSVAVSVTVKDIDQVVIVGARVGVYTNDGSRTQIVYEVTSGSGVADDTWAGSTPQSVEVRVRKASTGTKYIPFSQIASISSTGLALDVTLRADSNA
jgi:hypothetical protein